MQILPGGRITGIPAVGHRIDFFFVDRVCACHTENHIMQTAALPPVFTFKDGTGSLYRLPYEVSGPEMAGSVCSLSTSVVKVHGRTTAHFLEVQGHFRKVMDK